MRKIREVLRLRWEQGLSHRQIVTSCKLGQGTVGEYLRRALAAGLTWPLPDGLTDDVLERQLFPLPVTVPSAERPLPDWAVVHRELRRKGVTLLLLWEEYLPTPSGTAAFASATRRGARRPSPGCGKRIRPVKSSSSIMPA